MLLQVIHVLTTVIGSLKLDIMTLKCRGLRKVYGSWRSGSQVLCMGLFMSLYLLQSLGVHPRKCMLHFYNHCSRWP